MNPHKKKQRPWIHLKKKKQKMEKLAARLLNNNKVLNVPVLWPESCTLGMPIINFDCSKCIFAYEALPSKYTVIIGISSVTFHTF